MAVKRESIWNKLIIMCILISAVVLLSGCSGQAVPSQYDLKLKTKVRSLTVDMGGMESEVDITIDSRRYQELSSAQNVFLSYHILTESGELLEYDGIRTELVPIDARGVGKENVRFLAPLEAGNYQLEIDLVEENVTWFSVQGMPTIRIPLTVISTYEPPYTKVHLCSETEAFQITSGDVIRLSLAIQNDGEHPLYPFGPLETYLSYHIKDSKGNVLVQDGRRTSMRTIVPSRETCEAALSVEEALLETLGDCILSVDLVIEGVSWYGDKGDGAVGNSCDSTGEKSGE